MRSTRAGAARRAAARTRASRPYVDDGNDDDVVAIDEPAGPAPSRRSRVRPRRQNTRESESSAATDEEVVILDDDMQDLDLPIATRRGRRRNAGYVIDAAASTRGTHGLRGRAEPNGSLSRVRGINGIAVAQGNGDVLREYQSRPFNLTPAPHPRRLDGETFSEVKNVTAMCGKWLIVVLVSRSRSNWALPTIPLDIVDRFHVVQFSTASRYGRFLADSYHVDNVPAAIIIDPRTGEGLNIIQDLSSGEHDVPQILEEFVRENPNYAARDEYVRRIFNPHLQFDQDNGDLPPNEPSPRKRPSNSSAKSPKRSKMDVGGDDGLSDETRSLTMTDKDEWKAMVDCDGSPAMVRLRFPSGTSELVELTLSTKLEALFCFISGLGMSPVQHNLVAPFPRRVFTFAERDKTLADLGFTKSEHLHVDYIANVKDSSDEH